MNNFLSIYFFSGRTKHMFHRPEKERETERDRERQTNNIKFLRQRPKFFILRERVRERVSE
jgi:hypothetical protein